MTELTTVELAIRTLIVLGAIAAFATLAIGGTWYFAKPKKSEAAKPAPGRGAATPA